MIYQHEVKGADKTITDAIDTHVQDEQRKDGDDYDGSAGCPGLGGLMARQDSYGVSKSGTQVQTSVSDLRPFPWSG